MKITAKKIRLALGVVLAFSGLLLTGVLGLAAFIAHLARDPDPGQLQRLPTGCGAKGGDFEVLCPDGIPLLTVRGLPYLSSFEGKPGASLSLDGRWDWRIDSLVQGEKDKWHLGEWRAGESQGLSIPSTYNAPESEYRGHQGITWYRRVFTSPRAERDWRTFVRFDGVLLRYCAWLNGRALGCHEGGYTASRFEVTGLGSQDGRDTLVVRADNRLTWVSLPPRIRVRHNPVWGVYGGIYRSVFLESEPRSRLLKVYPRPYGPGDAALARASDTGLSSAGFELQVALETAQKGNWALRVTAISPAGRVSEALEAPLPRDSGLQGMRLLMPLKDIEPWQPGQSALYRLRLELTDGGRDMGIWEIRTGYRTLNVTEKGIAVNGTTRFLHGISMMEDDPRLGQSQDSASMARDMGWVDSLGADFVRLAHYPHHPDELILARESGLMVSEEIPYFHIGVGWSQWLVDFQGLKHFPATSFGMRQMRDTALLLLAQRSLLELIERDAANPAVILWSLGNESFDLGESAGEVYAWLRRSARAFDSSRPCAMAGMTYYQGWIDALRHGADSLDIVAINAYYGWYFGDSKAIGDQLDALHKRYPGKPLLITECGAEAGPGRREGAPMRTGDRVFFPRPYTEEYQAEVLAVHLSEAKRRPFVAGISPWVLYDFYCPWFPNNPVPEYNNKGLLTREREPKLGFRFLQGAYNPRRDSLPQLTRQ